MNFKSRIIIGCLLGVCTLQVSAEKTYKYRINLRDKAETAYSVGSPQAYLSERALERRERQGLKVDETDLPVCRTYIDAIIGKGASVVTKSKWNNTVVVEVVDTTLIEQIARLPFVTKTKKVWTSPDSIPARNPERRKEVTNKFSKTDNYYGQAYRQIAVHRGDSLHAAGFKGEGMQIAVIDAGFYNADEMKFFKKMHLLGIRDFVNPQSDIYAENYHGMKVLSCLAANQPDVLVGTAPEASYWLLRSEDDDTEQPVEEDYWAAALEFAVSHGHACQKQATSPQNVGDANEVPLARDTVPSFPATAELTPTAITSGFTRPSAVLPTDEKSAFTKFLSMAPTVMTFSASPGGVSFFQVPRPELPALHTTTSPLSAAIEAECDIRE
jgi:hypothetical protein